MVSKFWVIFLKIAFNFRNFNKFHVYYLKFDQLFYTKKTMKNFGGVSFLRGWGLYSRGGLLNFDQQKWGLFEGGYSGGGIRGSTV